MANTDSPRGFRPISHMSGLDPKVSNVLYSVTSSQAVYPGDIVKIVTAGTIQQAAATDNGAIIGVAADYVSAAATDRSCRVYTDPQIIYAVQGDDLDSATNLAITAVGATADLVDAAGGATFSGPYGITYGYSTMELDDSTVASGAQNLKILGLVDTPNNAWGEFAEVKVIINEGAFYTGVNGV